MGMTMAEKILARASGKKEVQAGDYVTANIDMTLFHDHFTIYDTLRGIGIDRIWDADKVAVFVDHYVPSPSVAHAESYKKGRESVKKAGIKNFYDWNIGICHQVMAEKGHAIPGTLIVGADSHTCTLGAFGAASTGMGSDLPYVMAKGKTWFLVPETIKVVLTGKLPRRTMSKDVVLYIAGKYGTDFALYKSLEFSGPVAQQMSMASRMTMSNMGVELGAKFAIFTADEKTLEFLKGRTNKPVSTFGPDPDARYEAVYEIDVSALEPQVALPHDIANAKPISEIGEIKVDQAFIGTCTNGRLEDLQIAAEIVKGKKVHPGTRMLVIPASQEVYGEAMRKGILATLFDAGASIGIPGCGPCVAIHMGLLASGEKCISSANRNFKGQMGSPDSEIYLGSPATVAASAIAGMIADPRKI